MGSRENLGTGVIYPKGRRKTEFLPRVKVKVESAIPHPTSAPPLDGKPEKNFFSRIIRRKTQPAISQPPRPIQIRRQSSQKSSTSGNSDISDQRTDFLFDSGPASPRIYIPHHYYGYYRGQRDPRARFQPREMPVFDFRWVKYFAKRNFNCDILLHFIPPKRHR